MKEALADPNSIFYYYRKLIELRHENDILTLGDYRLLLPDHPKLFVYERTMGEERWLVAANFSEENLSFDEIRPYMDEACQIVIGNYERTDFTRDLRPYEAMILKKIS